MYLPGMVCIGVIYVAKLSIFEGMQQSFTRAYTKATRYILICYILGKKYQKLHAVNYRNCHKKLAKLSNFDT